MERRTFLKFLGLAPAVAVPVVAAAAPAPLVMDATPLVAVPVVTADALMAAQTSEYAGSFTAPGVWSHITAEAFMKAIKDANDAARTLA